MTHPSRRTLLCSTAGLVALSAGCLDEAGLSSSPDESDPGENAGSGGDGTENGDENGDTDENDTENGDEDENGDENDDDTESTSNAGETDLESTDSVPFTRTDAPTEPDASLLADADDAGEWLESHAADDESVAEFVEETDFEESVLVALEAEGPTLCYELVVEDVALEEGDEGEDGDDPRLVLEASVSDESDGVGCAQQVIAAGRLVRATFSGDPVTDVSITIANHEGAVSAIGIATDSASDSASETDGESASDS